MGKQQNQCQFSAQPSDSNKKEYTDFEDMKSIFQYTHRRMGLGYSEEQFGESAGVVKGITKKQLVGADFDAKKKKQLDKNKKERETKSQQAAKQITDQDTDNIYKNDENITTKSQHKITETNKNQDDDDDFDEKESKTKLIPSKDKKRNFEVEIKTSKKKKAQKVFKIV
ncbi:hypothetical protein ABPG72_004688 [Tetrahymena utriculariae]